MAESTDDSSCVDTPDRAQMHSVRQDRWPERWSEGLPLGNGELGVMCWAQGGRLRFSMDSAGAWDLRHRFGEPDYAQLTYATLRERVELGDFDGLADCAQHTSNPDPIGPTKVHLGRFELDARLESCERFELSLGDAVVRADLSSADSAQRFEAFVCRSRDVFCFSLDPWPSGARLSYVPFYETSPGLAELGHPPVTIGTEEGLTVAVQHILPDAYFALCWNDTGPEVFVSFAEGRDEDGAAATAFEQHPLRLGTSLPDLLDAHMTAWHAFWSASTVVLPERDAEFLWYYGLYLLASSARKGSLPPGLQGVWAMDGRDPPWRGDYHADMNIQETFWPACPAGHLDLLDVWLEHLHACLPRAEAFTRTVFGTDGAFMPCAFLPHFTLMGTGSWTTVCLAWSHTGWLAHLAWLRWRYSMDRQWLAERGYPLVKSAFAFFAATIEEEQDGTYHIPLSSSPEYRGPDASAWCRDPNIDIALIRTCCDWIVEMEEALELDELSARAREIHSRLVGYHLVEFDYPASYVRGTAPKGRCVLALWEEHALDYSHRHPSHLMAIHPAMDITIEGSEAERRIIDASILQYLSLGRYCWAGHTYAQMISMAAVTGRGEMAYSFLRQYRDNWMLPNGLHVNRELGDRGNTRFWVKPEAVDREAPFTMEACCAVSCGISDMLVQGWGDCIRVFPALPTHWRDVQFTDLLTEGAFRVSASRRDGQTRWVRVTAGVERQCVLRNPFAAEGVQASGCNPVREGDDLCWPMAAGQTVTLSINDETPRTE